MGKKVASSAPAANGTPDSGPKGKGKGVRVRHEQWYEIRGRQSRVEGDAVKKGPWKLVATFKTGHKARRDFIQWTTAVGEYYNEFCIVRVRPVSTDYVPIVRDRSKAK